MGIPGTGLSRTEQSTRARHVGLSELPALEAQAEPPAPQLEQAASPRYEIGPWAVVAVFAMIIVVLVVAAIVAIR